MGEDEQVNIAVLVERVRGIKERIDRIERWLTFIALGVGGAVLSQVLKLIGLQ